MIKSILILDDDEAQVKVTSHIIRKFLPDSDVYSAFEESTMIDAIENRFYNLAIVDLNLGGFSFDGVDLIKKIMEINPFAKIIIATSHSQAYFFKYKDILLTGKIIDIITKPFEVGEFVQTVKDYYKNLDESPSEINSALLQFYANAKNELDTYKKGKKLENFVSLLFGSFGYKEIRSRNIDKSLNEVDLIIRNEIDDPFLSKFGKYILIECKNKPKEGVSKNDFIVFNTKLENTNGLAELGILITSGYISWNTYIEAVRTSKNRQKILFMSNPEIERMINSANKKEEFKRLIDEQVKDN